MMFEFVWCINIGVRPITTEKEMVNFELKLNTQSESSLIQLYIQLSLQQVIQAPCNYPHIKGYDTYSCKSMNVTY